jgi:hypothetical protein
MESGTAIAGTVVVEDPVGVEKEYAYEASYSTCREEIGKLAVTWNATIDGIEEQPGQRRFSVPTPRNQIPPAFVQGRIESSLVEHIEEVQL